MLLRVKKKRERSLSLISESSIARTVSFNKKKEEWVPKSEKTGIAKASGVFFYFICMKNRLI